MAPPGRKKTDMVPIRWRPDRQSKIPLHNQIVSFFSGKISSCGSYRPLRRIATAEQIAYTFLFLATDMSEYATGASFVVDGGRCS